MSSSRIILLLRGFSTGCCESQGMQNAELSQKEEGATGDNVRTGIVEPISLPPIHLPQKLQEAVNRVLLGELKLHNETCYSGHLKIWTRA